MSVTATAGEILGAYQLGLITQEEAREALGFTPEKKEDN